MLTMQRCLQAASQQPCTAVTTWHGQLSKILNLVPGHPATIPHAVTSMLFR